MKIAISGKGGVGKTTIAGTLARILTNKGFKVLAIDADPNANLALALGIPIEQMEKIIPISENDDLIEEKTGVTPSSYGGLFRLSFQVDDIIKRFGVKSPEGVNLLVMGVVRSSGQGCMCPANALIRALLRHLLIRRNELVIIDMEAGTEHLGRSTTENVDVMLIVTDANLKSLETAKNIYRLSTGMGVKGVFIIGNRVLDTFEEKILREFCDQNQFPILALIPYDRNIRESDVMGKPHSLSSESSGIKAIANISEKLIGSIGKQRREN